MKKHRTHTTIAQSGPNERIRLPFSMENLLYEADRQDHREKAQGAGGRLGAMRVPRGLVVKLRALSAMTGISQRVLVQGALQDMLTRAEQDMTQEDRDAFRRLSDLPAD